MCRSLTFLTFSVIITLNLSTVNLFSNYNLMLSNYVEAIKSLSLSVSSAVSISDYPISAQLNRDYTDYSLSDTQTTIDRQVFNAIC